jgi:hypothetical protein
MARGRRAHDVDTTPGKVLALALLANAPILLGFVLAPLFGGPEAARAFVPYVLLGTPPVAAASLWFFARAAPERRAHRAARIGVLLDGVGLLLWALVALPLLLG